MGRDLRKQEAGLTRQVLLPVTAGERMAYFLGIAMAIVLFAGAVDVFVWKYSSERAQLKRRVRVQSAQIELIQREVRERRCIQPSELGAETAKRPAHRSARLHKAHRRID